MTSRLSDRSCELAREKTTAALQRSPSITAIFDQQAKARSLACAGEVLLAAEMPARIAGSLVNRFRYFASEAGDITGRMRDDAEAVALRLEEAARDLRGACAAFGPVEPAFKIAAE